MHIILRKLTGLGLAIAASTVAPFAAAAQTDMLSLREPSITGSYLAGLAAQDDLNPGVAAEFFMRAAEADWDNPILTGRAFLAYLGAGKISEAAPIAQHVLDLDPADELARLTLGTVALKERRYTSADQMFARIPNLSLVGITAGITRAWAQLGNGDLAGANATLDSIGQGGFEEFLVFHRAVMADLGGNREQAITLSRQAYEIDPFVTRIAEAYIRILGNAGRFEEAQAVLDRFTEEGIAHPVIDALRKPIAEGRKPGLFAANIQAGAAEVYHGLGAALARDGSSELSIIFLRLALYLDPDADIVSMSLGDILSAAGRYDAANEIYASIPETSPLRTSALISIAENFDAQERQDEAISRLRNIINNDPGNVEALGALGDILRYDEQWEGAAEAYSQLLDAIDGERPRDWRFYYVRGIAYERASNWDAAEADFLHALELNPEQPQVLNYLGYTWVDKGMNLETALDMIQRAVEMRPRDGYIIDSLGWAYFKLGRIEDAVAELERAVSLLPNDPELNDHLGDAYWMAGRRREAMFQWRIAIDVDEEGTVTARARPKLIHGLDGEATVANGNHVQTDVEAH
ncbi:tetratricopeptide repeat protein [Pelagibacterium halotolerans]|uniref:tetratricopeptide repeat protein n=1 Tax=Pelagibacterium halotolerans TaxID=531813 RepID=UPI00384C2083